MPDIVQTKEQLEALEKVVQNLDTLKALLSITAEEQKDEVSVLVQPKKPRSTPISIPLDIGSWERAELMNLLTTMQSRVELETRSLAEKFNIRFTKKEEAILEKARESQNNVVYDNPAYPNEAMHHSTLPY